MILEPMYWVFPQVVEKHFCEYVLSHCDWSQAIEGVVSYQMGNNEIDHSKRKVDVLWQDANPLHGLIQMYMSYANTETKWNFNIQAFEPVQVARYTEHGIHDWHADINMPQMQGLQRKLSAVLLLNSPKEYEGGALEVKDGNPEAPLKEAGDMIVFPSFVEHRVAPLLSGVRYSATCWASGAPFR
jgi:PKHD-type hydroxylase